MSNMPGQASDGFVGSSSALRILYVGHRNSFAAKLATDGFTQTNPPHVGGAARSTTLHPTPKYGVLSGSIAFTRPDAGNGFIGGPTAGVDVLERPLGLFINDAAGNAYENTPAPASGVAPYVSCQGTCGVMLYETQNLNTNAGLVWSAGNLVYASKNGYITNVAADDNTKEQAATGLTVLGVVKIAPDAAHGEIVFDLRV
jgi:hypothetical protein